MSELLAVVWMVIGGVVAGKALVRMGDGADQDDAVPIFIMTLVVWLAWPLAWGVMRASDAADKQEGKPHDR